MAFYCDPSEVEFAREPLAEVLREIAEGKALLVDVRSDEEWAEGHVEGAIFLPVMSLVEGCDPAALAAVLPAEKVLYTHCRVGMRAKAAAMVLGRLGYEVRPLEPGFEELVEAGFRPATLAP